MNTNFRNRLKIVKEEKSLKHKDLEVSLDYLAGNTDLEMTDKPMNRIKEVARMTEKDKDYVYTLTDTFIAKRKIQSIL
ncbi:hypothetical protein R5O20_06800 [Tenacibaculum maritimum]|uniref:hypothetical protein n=1 Tax=Tenacibaculum maritimum TaxID=107401 RepID=UPI00388FF575